MRNINSLKNREFKKIYENGKSYVNKYLVMYVLREENIGANVGISVSKKVGNSVVRHRITRLIRESYRLNCGLIHDSDYSIVVVARAATKGKNFADIESAFLHLLRLHGLIDKKEKTENNENQ